ncbi:MAG: TRAP transporter small permease subunit [Gammaproteobacteria bacterium]|nr:TRAP transporter small permease subunit [Gammaproteobacteria bacterium]CAJ2377622.1 MAG: TRAP transporter permease DctQ [Arenicellales bacterium IbO2]MDA7962841.1 TRAP transporter small permease subunit [Gammaproteobacteria bacterium]MDA7969000.1 TRAP transporter small permease subunit [Gammaproteobacteria bacterium]MDA7970347.1 TRAP transporter small permease subunit [Gammaproteobacteria bacterium]
MPPDLDPADELIAERRADPGKMPADMPAWMAATILRIDAASLWIGRLVCWMLLPLCLSMVYEVVARKFFLAPTMWAYDISRMFYGGMFMLGAGYALSRGVHIRADFLYRNWKPRAQGMVDAALYLGFYFPGLAVFMWTSVDYAWLAIERGERGMDTAWMPYMGPVKSVLPVGAALLLMQGVSETLKSVYAARTGRWP